MLFSYYNISNDNVLSLLHFTNHVHLSVVFFYFNRLDFDTDNLNPSNSTGLNIKNRNVPTTFPIRYNNHSYSFYKLPHSPLFAYTSLNLAKQNVDLTGFCYILLSFVKPRKLDPTFLYIVELIKTSPQN